MGAGDRVCAVVSEKALMNVEGGQKPEGETNGRITLEGINFHYPTNKDVPVLKGIDIEVENDKKRVVALCGTSGCGKSSVIKLI